MHGVTFNAAKETEMRMTRTALPILIGAASLVVVAMPASAQDQKREAAIRKCVQTIQQIIGTKEEDMDRRAAAWKACMTQQGERP
jgi:hypothetical protein